MTDRPGSIQGVASVIVFQTASACYLDDKLPGYVQ